MNHSSSFFWASDDLIRNNNDDSGDDCGVGSGGIDDGVGAWPSHAVHPGLPLWEEEHIITSESDDNTHNTSLEELEEGVMALNNKSLDKSFKRFNSYGSADTNHEERRFLSDTEIKHHLPIPIHRRRLFDISTDRHEHSDWLSTASIRFQVVIWHIGMIDVQSGHVKMRFRLTLFWNDDNSGGGSDAGAGKYFTSKHPTKGRDTNDNNNAKPVDSGVWVMEGRQRAYRKEWNHQSEASTSTAIVREVIDVPPVSILNAVEFEMVDEPDITMVNVQSRGMRWTCMYNATLFQGDHLSVKDFPHDEHQIKLKLGILAHRIQGGRWDHNLHKLGLAREEDSLGSTRVPHGLVVEHCHIPDFGFDPTDLCFRFLPLSYGGRKVADAERDVYLEVMLPCHRQSGHYDSSIFPMLFMLNVIAISCLTRNFGSASAATEIMLSIAFVQVGIRLTLDSRLPSVGYQIKMQKVMNGCFWLLCGLVLESNIVFFLVTKRGWEIATTDKIDLASGCVALVYNIYIALVYFCGKKI